MRANEVGENKPVVKVEGTAGLNPGAAFLTVLGTRGKSLLVSASHLSSVKLIIISLQQKVGAVSRPMKTVDPICEDK